MMPSTMTLHHCPHISDIRSAYDGVRSQSEFEINRSVQSSRPRASNMSVRTQSLDSKFSMARMQRVEHHSSVTSVKQRYFPDRPQEESPRSSSETYASTVPSEDEEESQEDECEYPVSPISSPSSESQAIPATPAEFSELFPSTRKLAIRHDDSTPDGNLNLRLDTDVLMEGGSRGKMTLFHLRMHDLKTRKFSLRRYCRDSGREICHSERKRPKLASLKRPGLQRSLTSAFNGILPKADPKNVSALNGLTSLKRHDSGYGSMDSMEVDNEGYVSVTDPSVKSPPQQRNTVQLEFSNYAQVAVKRTGYGSHRRYEFEYWGTNYAWRRSVRNVGDRREVSFHLHAAGNDKNLAYIVPSTLSSSQVQEEKSRGGWIPPCSMWIADKGIIGAQKDVADVVIASGLIALVDDAIKRHFRVQDSRQLVIPVPKFHIGVEYVGPKQILTEMFRRGSQSAQGSRRPSLARARPSSSGGEAPMSPVSKMPIGTVRQCSYDQ